ncbi:MAG: hypothetical protein JSR57_11560, partial [Verrucomicrobia bacterium]|nr:hypothetical protein [Verrucomicrobiota bacterium]
MFQIDTRHSYESRSSSKGLAPAYVINFPLHHAIRSYNQGPAIELITTTEKANASALNTFDYFGDSPLYLAVHNKLCSVIDVLILFGADTQKVNSRGDTLQTALEKCRFRFAVFEGASATSLNQQCPSFHLAHSVASLQDDVTQPSRKHKHRPTLQRTQVSTLTPLPTPQSYPSPSLGQHSTVGTPRSHSAFSVRRPFRLSSSNAPLKSLEKEISYNPEITSYLNAVKKMLEDRQFDILSHTYFLFIDEDILLDCFLSMGLKHKKPISKFILSLMAHGFPNGLDKMAASSKKLAELTRVCGIDFPFINQIAAGNVVLKNPLQSSQTSEATSINQKIYHHMTPLELADMLTFRDVESISRIGLSEVKEWLHYEKNISVSIRTAGDNFNKTAKWIVSILDSCEGEAQDSAIEFFTSTGTI